MEDKDKRIDQLISAIHGFEREKKELHEEIVDLKNHYNKQLTIVQKECTRLLLENRELKNRVKKLEDYPKV